MLKIKIARNLILIGTLILLFVFVIFFSKKNLNMDNSNYNKVLIIGIDGMDYSIINKLIGTGKLLNFKKLSEHGSFLKLKTSNPPNSPVAWTTLATGVNSGKHNIFDFIGRNPENYLPELSLSKARQGIGGTEYQTRIKADPFWKIASDVGVENTVIRWPMTFPVQKIEGELLAGLGVPDVRGLLGGYSYYSQEDVVLEKSSNKSITVEISDNKIITNLYGPKTIKNSEPIEISIPIEIRLLPEKNSAELNIQNKTYTLNAKEWSKWIGAEFKISFLRKTTGIFKAYLISLDPFKLYITAVQMDPQNPLVDISYPQEYSKQLASEIGQYYTLGIPEETDAVIDGILDNDAFLKQIDEIEAERDGMFWREFENFKTKDRAIMAIVYDSSDRLQHMNWDYGLIDGNEIKLDNNKIINSEIINYYQKKDEFLGNVLDQIDDKTALFILSDHGFTSFERAVGVNTWLKENGFLVLNKEIGSGDDGELFKYVDWDKTKAYAVGFNSIFLNLKGREKQGVVVNKNEVLNNIISGLESLIDNKTGQRAVNKVYRKEEIWSGEYLEDAPDLIIGYNVGYRTSWQTAIGGFASEIIYDNNKAWKGDHLVDPIFVPGVLFSNLELNKKEADQIDIAPTILNLLNIKIPNNIDGDSLMN